MPLLDVFNTDAFNTVSLTEAINAMPHKPSRLGDLGLFEETGVTTTTVVIEHKRGQLNLLQSKPRGDGTQLAQRTKRDVRPFIIPHIPYNDTVLASDVQNVRAFGSESTLETVAQVVAEQLAQMRMDHETTWEWHRMGAIKGKILDADATTLLDIHAEFGVSLTSTDITTATDDIKQVGVDLKRRVEAALGGDTYSRIHIFCGDTFFDNITSNTNVKTAYDRFQESAFFREDQRFEGFEMPRGVIWENYRGTIGNETFILDDEAYAVPLGVPGLFKRYNAPADFVETVNTIGQPLYAKQERMKFDLGIELHTQSNPLHLVTRPTVLQRLHDTAI